MIPAVILIDLQQDFFDEAPQAFRDTLLPNCRRLLEVARALPVPVIHVITRYHRDRSDWPMAWQHRDTIWCLEGSAGAEILADVRPRATEPVVVKNRFSGFHQTALDSLLQEWRVDSLFLAGYAGDVCVRLTALDAYNRGYHLYLLSDCVRSAREEVGTSLQYLQWLTNAAVIESTEIRNLVCQTEHARPENSCPSE